MWQKQRSGCVENATMLTKIKFHLLVLLKYSFHLARMKTDVFTRAATAPALTPSRRRG
ncbi:hypothetical protein CSK29544_04267 [Cronobacter sakazakii]|nr:hypothetical protein CSK29544_04267 [Cronobacter sakazakii]